jgi:hypothetical protein
MLAPGARNRLRELCEESKASLHPASSIAPELCVPLDKRISDEIGLQVQEIPGRDGLASVPSPESSRRLVLP